MPAALPACGSAILLPAGPQQKKARRGEPAVARPARAAEPDLAQGQRRAIAVAARRCRPSRGLEFLPPGEPAVVRILLLVASGSNDKEERMQTKRAGAILALLLGASPWAGCGGSEPAARQPSSSVRRPATVTPRVIFIAIDSLHPTYLSLNAEASGPGRSGDWLMPNVRSFVEQTAYWLDARGHAPYATDMNHLNVLAGTNSGLTGVVGVYQQVAGWGALGATYEKTHVSRALYPDGTPVQTLFDLAKAAGSAPRTAFLSNKGWVAEMYAPTGSYTGSVDVVLNGKTYLVDGKPQAHPVPPPTTATSWHDNPASDPDRACDPESSRQTLRLALSSAKDPADHPRDLWIAQSALEVMKREQPDFAYVLLGDLDHGQHFLGAVNDPQEWVPTGNYTPPAGCPDLERYHLVSGRNPNLYKEPALDLIRDVDLAFKALIEGLETGGYLQGAVVVLVSDHAMINHLYFDGIEEKTDIAGLLEAAGLAPKRSFEIYGAASVAALYWRPEYKLANPGVVQQAKAVLLAHRVKNPMTGADERPWEVIDRGEMSAGRADLGIDPKELLNPYFVKNGVWPDLAVMATNGWPIPSAGFNIGQGSTVKVAFNAGHGAMDTARVVLAVKGLAFPVGPCSVAARLADVAPTLAPTLGVTIKTTVGKPLSCAP
jgi:hypothetical protein